MLKYMMSKPLKIKHLFFLIFNYYLLLKEIYEHLPMRAVLAGMSLFISWLHCAACRSLAPRPETEPRAPEVEVWLPGTPEQDTL